MYSNMHNLDINLWGKGVAWGDFLARSGENRPEASDHTVRLTRDSSDKRLLVLVADDEPIIAETLVEILNGEGF